MASPSSEIGFDRSVARLLLSIAVVLAVAGFGLAIALLQNLPFLSLLVQLHIGLGLVGLASAILIRSGREKLAAILMIWGYWIGATALTMSNGGLRGPNLINYPLIVVIAGWILGTRQTLYLVALTEVLFVGLLVGDAENWVPPADYVNPSSYLMFLTSIVLATAVMTLLSRRAYAGRVDEARQKAGELAAREGELRHLKDNLDVLVAVRTAELEKARGEAEAANTTKDAFLANMSHELRTPLSAVIGIANLAQGISSDPKLSDYLEKIVRSGKHLNRIINELLDLSKIAAGHMELEIITFSLRAVIAHVESVMSHRAAEKGLAIFMVIDDAVPDVLRGDPTRLAQIFLNLIGNAIKFTHTGRIAIRVGLHASEESRVCLDIDIEDTGIGMRPEDLQQLFKPFTQADATVARKYGGTGLGLTISRRLAEMMDGDISVTSIEGSGTTFKLRIWLGMGNAIDLPPAELAADDALPKRYQDARILVADDQPLNREIVEALLAAVGITPRLAENGQEALDILTESGADDFDLVLMDIQMPIMDGLTATRVLRSILGFESLPIIAMTARTLAHEQELNAAAGMNGHIGKPFDNVSFYRTLEQWIPQAKQKATDATQALPAKHEALPEAGTELSSLRGVDVAAGLARFSGKEASYRRWLGDFVATSSSVPGQMRGEIAAGQADKAGKLAHVFKGRVGMLGMTELHGMVSALELVLNEGAPADELLTTLERSINEMRHELARVMNPGAADTANTASAKSGS